MNVRTLAATGLLPAEAIFTVALDKLFGAFAQSTEIQSLCSLVVSGETPVL